MSNISFIKYPDSFVLTGNPIFFKIACKNALASPGVKSKISISNSKPEAITIGKYLRFSWNDKTVTFVCAETPDGLQFPPIIRAGELCPFLTNSALLNDDFVITTSYENYYTILEARKPGSIYDLTITSDQMDDPHDPLVFGFSIGFFQVDGADPSSKSFKLCVKPEADNEFITTLDLPVAQPRATDILPAGFDDTAGIVETYELEKLFEKKVDGHFTFPEPDAGFFAKHNIVKSFRLYAFGKDGFPPVITDGCYSPEIHYLQGKLSNFTQGELNDLDKTFYDKLVESKMFLTKAPPEKQTDIYAPEKLYFPFLNAGTSKLKAKEYYEDGTVNDSTRLTFAQAAYDICEFFVSYKHIRTNAPKKLVKYDIYLTDNNDNILSETRTFVIDYRDRPYARYFLFKNSFGVYDCIRTTGKVDKNRDVKKDFIKVSLANKFKETDQEEKQISADTETSYQINSGYFPDKYHSEWWQEFTESDDNYWLKRSKAYPVNIKDNKTKVSADGDFNPYSDLTLTHAIHDDFTEVFSAQEPIIVGDCNIDFNTDYFTGATGTTPPEEPPIDPEPGIFNFEDNFDTWTDGLPSGWGKDFTSPVIVNNADRVSISVPENPGPTFAGIHKYFPSPIAIPKRLKVTVKVDAISHAMAFKLIFEGWAAGNKEILLKLGVNELTFDLNFACSQLFISDFIIEQYAGAYPHTIIIDYIKIEEVL